MSPILMHVVVVSVLASLLPITSVIASPFFSSSSSSLLSITGDLAPSLLPFTLVMLVAGTRVAAAANYSTRQLQDMMMPGGGGATRSRLSNGPSPRHLNAEMLRTRMGADFNSDWMSVDAPSQATRAGANVPPTDGDDELLDEIREMGFSYTDEHGDRRTMPSAVRSIVERWLVERASCQVHYTWVDMGEYFWPRWVKHGRCDTETPCSWPSGMHCAATESDTLRLMHWQCGRAYSNRKVRHAGKGRPRGGGAGGRGATTSEAGAEKTKSRKMECRWKKVPYPVTSECFCSC